MKVLYIIIFVIIICIAIWYMYTLSNEEEENYEINELSNYLARVNARRYFSQVPFVHFVDSRNFRKEVENFKDLEEGTIVAVIDHHTQSCCYSTKNINNFLDLENIDSVIAENWIDNNHKKLRYWPIGLESKMIMYKPKLFDKIVYNSGLKPNKKILSNAHFVTYSKPNSGYRDDRKDMINDLKNNRRIDFWKNKKSQEETIEVTSSYRYALCPEGNGLDTHRFYETYLMDVIPIVRKGPLTPLQKEFKNTIVVNKWSDVGRNDIVRMTRKEVKNDKKLLTMGYWLNRYLRHKVKVIVFSDSVNKNNILYSLNYHDIKPKNILIVGTDKNMKNNDFSLKNKLGFIKNILLKKNIVVIPTSHVSFDVIKKYFDNKYNDIAGFGKKTKILNLTVEDEEKNVERYTYDFSTIVIQPTQKILDGLSTDLEKDEIEDEDIILYFNKNYTIKYIE